MLTIEEFIIQKLEDDNSPWAHTLWESLGPDALHNINNPDKNREVNKKVIALIEEDNEAALGRLLINNAWDYLEGEYYDAYLDYVGEYERDRQEWLLDTRD